jgi:RNA polymerase sigma factor (sigma-70 family)
VRKLEGQPRGPKESQDHGTAPPPGQIRQVADRLFRHEAGRLVATLTRIFGPGRLSLAEDVVQEALVRALQTWPYYGVPTNPSAWITQVSKNLALDVIRRERLFHTKEPELAGFLEQVHPAADDSLLLDGEIADDRLRMMFVCCHPLLPPDAQIALALRTLCGFSAAEIGKAFLTTEAATAKRLTRARQQIREARIPFEIPAGKDLSARLEGVLHTLYLLFNEGYKASTGDRLVREELCHEAIRLATLLVEHPAGARPRTHALLALMLLNAARLPTRVDAAGNVLRLKEQDRSRWDRGMIARGMFHLARSADGSDLSTYHLQAGIAACHCAAHDYASTDWPHILALYDQLSAIDDSPIVALNRAVAVANVHGPAEGLAAVAAIRYRGKLDAYYLLYAVLGDFEAQLNHPQAAADYFRESLRQTEIKSEQWFLSKRIRECEEQSRGRRG